MEILSKSERETIGLGRKVGGKLKGGELILLEGDLGSGKTVFVKGIAAKLGVKEEITSPTYVVLRSYRGDMFNLYHFDFYRVDEPSGSSRIDIADISLDQKGIFLVEWPANFPKKLFRKIVRVEFKNISGNERLITVSGLGDF